MRCFGHNHAGRLGTTAGGNYTTYASGVTVAVPNAGAHALKVDIGGRHACVARNDGKVYCWGANAYGQLGNGLTSDSAAPVQVVGISDATDVLLHHDTSCALRTGGKVSCWGRNDLGQTGANLQVDFSANMFAKMESGSEISPAYGQCSALNISQ